MTTEDVQKAIRQNSNFYGVYVPEFTYGDGRIDAVVIDTNLREIKGFEIKVSRRDFLSDRKWTYYSRYCTSLAVVCPEGLIQPEEIESPFGLYWVDSDLNMKSKKRVKRVQSKRGLAWLWRYAEVLERELPRLDSELTSAQFSLHEYDILTDAKKLVEHVEKNKPEGFRWNDIDQICYRIKKIKTKDPKEYCALSSNGGSKKC